MPIPKYDEMYREFLETLSDGQMHKISEIRDTLAIIFHVSDDERKELLPSGKQPLFNNRVNWTSSYLKQAGLIKNTSRGVYCIAESGKKLLASDVLHIDNNFLLKFDSFKDFLSRSTSSSSETDADSTSAKTNNPIHQQSLLSSESPQDILDDAYTKIKAALIDDVLTEVMKQTPVFFEQMVVTLLTKMGYGGSLKNAGTVTKVSGDEGIDGIIREDKLGFNLIYIQAKRWDRNSTVGRPEIQKFVGALAGQGATRGLFITTAQFTKEAIEYAHKQHTTKIILIDGASLAELMIEYNVGVSVEATYSIKKIDSDFFDDNSN